MFFRDVIGQKELKERLIKSVKEGRVSHAQLFSGPEGAGKLPLALAYSQYISCRNRGDEDSCGVCPSCHKYQKLIHPDLHFVFPIFRKKDSGENPTSDDFIHKWREFVLKNPYFSLNQWLSFIDVENKQAIIYEKESESILRKLSLKSFESEFKVMIIWLPEKMHAACSNKLLKIIEEPPNKTLFLLVSEDEENIISTIRSRAQLFVVPKIDEDSMRIALKSIDGFDDSIIDDAIRIADGSFARALEYITPDDDKLFYFTKFQELMRLAYTIDTLGLLEWAESLAGIGREKQKGFFDNALRLTREFFIQNLKVENLNYLKLEEKEWGKKFSPFINERNISLISAEFDLAFKHISANGNPKIIFLDVALKMAKHIRK